MKDHIVGRLTMQKHMMNIGAPEEYLEDMRSFLNLKGWRQHNDLLPNGWAWTVRPKGGRPKILWRTRASGSIHHQVWTQSRGEIKPGKIFYSWHTADLRLQGESVHRIGGKNSNNIKAVEMFNSDLTADQEFRSLRVKQITNRCEVHKSWKRPW